MYQWAQPWNPLGGECPHKCSYCSSNALKQRYEAVRSKYSGPPQLYPGYPPASDKIIFVAGQNDLFAKEIPTEWILEVLRRCHTKENKYFFQTKNPARYLDFLFDFPTGSVLCTTIETNRWYPEIMGHTPRPSERAEAMGKITHYEKQITIEPVINFDIDELVTLIRITKATKINLGADSKHNHLPEPSKEKLLALIDELNKFTMIDRKSNLERLLK